ncbi:MAG: T9SS type A sorting domain-containing protein [Bacteroidota bacterium]|nr:T9SS type A sorting domain-containing protein [Bacteroidota bacterium]
MKKTKIFSVALLAVTFFVITISASSQSVLTLHPGSSMGVSAGADLCVNIVTGGGILYGNGTICGGIITNVPISSNEMPTVFGISQNYPNPFNPTTNFGFRIPNFGFVSLKVYDVFGKEVTTLVNEVKHPGEYSVKGDASGLASGLYFYRIQAGNFIETKKLLLLK